MDFLGGEMSPSPVASLVVLPTLSDVSYFCFSCFPISWNGESCLQHVRTVQDPDTPWHLQVVSTPALMTCRHTHPQKNISYGERNQSTEPKNKTKQNSPKTFVRRLLEHRADDNTKNICWTKTENTQHSCVEMTPARILLYMGS